MADLRLVIKKKNELQAAMGEEAFDTYLSKLNLFFHREISKDEFDIEARKLIRREAVHLHNELFLLVCDMVSSSLPTYKPEHFYISTVDKAKSTNGHTRKSLKTVQPAFDTGAQPDRFQNSFKPADIESFIPAAVSQPHSIQATSCVRERTLPDISSIHGIMLVSAWKNKIDHVHGCAVKMMTEALRYQMKVILMAIISRRSAYKLRENKFKYAMGVSPINIYLRNAQKFLQYPDYSQTTSMARMENLPPSMLPTGVDWAESEAATITACSTRPRRKLPPISPWDLYDTLQMYQGLIPSHAVRSSASERAITAIHHPSSEEIERECVKKQERMCSLMKSEIQAG